MVFFYLYYDFDGFWCFIVDVFVKYNEKYSIDVILIVMYGVSIVFLDCDGNLVVLMLDYEYIGFDDLVVEYDVICLYFWEIGLFRFLFGFNVGV